MQYTRVHIPMTKHTRSQLQALADARSCSLAAVCRDLLAEVSPVAGEMAKALQMAKKTPSRALREMNQAMDQQLAEIDQIKLDLSPKATGRKYTRKKTG